MLARWAQLFALRALNHRASTSATTIPFSGATPIPNSFEIQALSDPSTCGTSARTPTACWTPFTPVLHSEKPHTLPP
ncbi:hypothetical protein GCM10023160_05870 [Brachybacterium paraconglomeratum]